jgi:hypothetical protein
MSQVPKWLYKPANLTKQETKLIQFELLGFLKNFCKENNTNFLSLTNQFICLTRDHLFNNLHNLPTLNKVLSRMQIKHFFKSIGFIVVNENKYFPIHIDHYDTEWMNVGLNIPVLNCDGSRTVWYDSMPDDNDEMPEYIGEITKISSSVSVKCIQDNVKEIGSCDANKPHWINIAVPHAPRCTHSKLRINASLRFNTFENNFIDTEMFEQLMVQQSL